jgi:hypothetical protein
MDRKDGSHNEKIVHKLSSYAQTPETNIGEIGIYIITNFSIDKLYCYWKMLFAFPKTKDDYIRVGFVIIFSRESAVLQVKLISDQHLEVIEWNIN